MADYAVGDIQGCFRELLAVLEQASFDLSRDRLWLAGDLINRGPDSESTLAFLYQHRKSIRCVLGNHDLHFLAIYYGIRKPRRSDTFDDILKSRHCDDWADWLRSLPLCLHDAELNYTLVHAGIAPQWTLAQALKYSAEVEAILQSDKIELFLNQMYGDEPSLWDSSLTGYERLRCITNYFTRMRLVDQYGALDLAFKGGMEQIPRGYYAWFKHPQRQTKKERIIFGHWAALDGHVDNQYLFGLDTGCVWGGTLTMMDMKNHNLFIAQARH